MNHFLDWASQLSLPEAGLWLFAANLATCALAVGLGAGLAWTIAARRITPAAEPLTRRELGYTTCSIAVNTLVTVAGWQLWKSGWIIIRQDTGWLATLDVLFLVFVMDFGLYVLHRVAHLPWFFKIHRLHHAYENSLPLTLFVVHPLETLGFGLFWLVVIGVYSSSWLGLAVYLALNLGAGTLGHLGVEPFPSAWARVPILRGVGTSTFHARHHQNVTHNFGFYTTVWDRWFGTLSADLDSLSRHSPTTALPDAAAVRDE